MFQIMLESEGKIIGLRATGKLTDTDLPPAVVPSFKLEWGSIGPGLDLENLRQHLLIPGYRREVESSQLGIKVTLTFAAKFLLLCRRWEESA